jgi:lipopolysaccharide export system protein LptA
MTPRLQPARPTKLVAPLLVLLLLATTAHAEKADREKPVNLEADRITVDDVKRQQVFEGNVQLVQGTLIIRTDKLVVLQDADGFQKGIAYGGAGGLAHFRQKQEGKDEYIDGEAERIEHDSKSEKTEFFIRSYVKSGLDEVRGQFISYDGKTENYVVTGGAKSSTGKQERVRAVIQPKNKDGAKTAPSNAAQPSLKTTTVIANPRPE